MGQLLKGGAILGMSSFLVETGMLLVPSKCIGIKLAISAEGVPSTSSQQEFSARLESGEEAQVIQIGKPIPLSSQV